MQRRMTEFVQPALQQCASNTFEDCTKKSPTRILVVTTVLRAQQFFVVLNNRSHCRGSIAMIDVCTVPLRRKSPRRQLLAWSPVVTTNSLKKAGEQNYRQW